MARFLRASILQNIYEWLFERFPTVTNNTVVASTWEVNKTFSQKQNKKAILKLRYTWIYEGYLRRWKKTYLFMFLIIWFSLSPLHIRRRLPYIIKDDSSKVDFRTWINRKIKLITHLRYLFGTIIRSLR